MKVAHFIDSGGFYGAERMLVELILAMPNCTKHKVYSIGAPSEGEKPLEIELRKCRIDFEAVRIPKFSINAAHEVLKQVEREGFQIAHSHGYKFNVYFGILKGKTALKLVSTIHGYIPAFFPSKLWFYQVLDAFFVKRLDRLFLVSPHMLNFAKFKSIASKKLRVIVNGIEDLESSSNWNATGGTINLLFVGRLSFEKGILELVESVAKIRNSGGNVALSIMGEGPLRETIVAKVKELKLQDSIHLLGYVENPSNSMGNYDALVINSVTEGVPITLLESMRAGLPVVTTDVGGISYVLGKTYPFICCEASGKSVEEKINQYIRKSKDQKNEISRNIKKRFAQQFTSAIMAEQYINEYKVLLSNSE